MTLPDNVRQAFVIAGSTALLAALGGGGFKLGESKGNEAQAPVFAAANDALRSCYVMLRECQEDLFECSQR